MPGARKSNQQIKPKDKTSTGNKPKAAGRAPAPSVPGEKRVKPTAASVGVGPAKREPAAGKGDMPDTLDARKQFRGTDEHAAVPSRARDRRT